MKRKRPDFDLLDPETYRPNTDRLWDCVCMSAGLKAPSARFMSVLTWHREYPDDLMEFAQGDAPCVPVPPSTPHDMWTEMAWVLGPRRCLELPSGANILVSPFRPNGNCANHIRWTVHFPEAMGGNISWATWSYDILASGLYQTRSERHLRPHGRTFTEPAPHLTGNPVPALKKRGRWFSSRPEQIVPAPPPLAQATLERLWERKVGPKWCRSLVQLNVDSIGYGGIFKSAEAEKRALVKDDRLFGVVVWLFLKGYTNVAAHRDLGCGPVSSYLLKRRKDVVDSSQDIPDNIRKRVISVFRDAACVDRILNEFANLQTDSAGVERKALHEHFEDRFDSLVIDVLFDHVYTSGHQPVRREGDRFY